MGRRSRSREKDWLKKREERSRSRERRGWSREERSHSRERWRGGEMSNSSTSGDRRRRRERSRSKSGSEELSEWPVASGERTPSPASCARLPPHLLGGWTVLKD